MAVGMSAPGRPAFTRPRQLANWRRGGGARRALGCVLVTLTSLAGATPVLHEYIELGPGKGLVEPALTGLPSSAGLRAGGDGEPEPGGAAPEVGGAPAMPGSTFSIDRDTTRPDRVSYSDPFTPTVVPFKRSVVYDTVNRNAELLVRDTTLTQVRTLTQARATDEHFHASMRLDLTAGERTPIPSVAPGARLVVAYAEPRVALRIGVDSAENWFVESKSTAQVLLTLQVAADRRAFGSAFGRPGWSDLARQLPPLPVEIKRSALEVARALGVDETAPPARAVDELVEHFRRFTPSEQKPQSQGLALYRELALTARGICRHRAYAFTITALGLGIPTRLALNEAHAWVEVFDGDLWHRIDLGGAAEQLEMDDEGRPRHVEPSDPFDWPDRNESGLAMAERRVPAAEAEAGAEPSSTDGQSDEPTPAPAEQDPTEPAPSPAAPEPLDPPGDAPAPLPEPAAPPPPALPDDLPRQSVQLRTAAAKAERGKGLLVSGQVQDDGYACSGASIEITLQQAGGEALALGTLVSDARGEFRGHLVVPWNASLGEHTLAASARGHCPKR